MFFIEYLKNSRRQKKLKDFISLYAQHRAGIRLCIMALERSSDAPNETARPFGEFLEIQEASLLACKLDQLEPVFEKSEEARTLLQKMSRDFNPSVYDTAAKCYKRCQKLQELRSKREKASDNPFDLADRLVYARSP